MSKNPNLDLHDFTVVHNQNLEAITFGHVQDIGKIALGYSEALQGGCAHDLKIASAGVLEQTTAKAKQTARQVNEQIRQAAPGFLSFIPERDRTVYDEALKNIPIIGMGNVLSRVRRDTSTKLAARIMELYLSGTQTSESHQGRRHGSGGREYQAPPRQEQTPPRTEQQHPPRTTQTPRAERTPTAAQIVDPIIGRVEDKASQKSLLHIDKDDVLRVINTVKEIRRRAEEKGQLVTDQQIYIRYRKAIEVENPNQKLVESSKILLNLMGSKARGKLPF